MFRSAPRSSSLGPGGRERLPSSAPGHRKPAQATCWTLSGCPRSCSPKPAPRSGAPRVPYASATEKFHSRLLLWLPFLFPITHIHTSLIFEQLPLFNEARLASPRARAAHDLPERPGGCGSPSAYSGCPLNVRATEKPQMAGWWGSSQWFALGSSLSPW